MDYFLTTVSGSLVDLQNPLPEQINIVDIAVGLSNCVRFHGQVSSFYSVAQHSILVSKVVKPEYALVALLHDAPEAYIGDMSTPMKRIDSVYCEVEARLWAAIAQKFSLPFSQPYEIKEVDRRMFATERRDLIKHDARYWSVLLEPYDFTIEPMTNGQAYKAFIERFRELTLQ